MSCCCIAVMQPRDMGCLITNWGVYTEICANSRYLDTLGHLGPWKIRNCGDVLPGKPSAVLTPLDGHLPSGRLDESSQIYPQNIPKTSDFGRKMDSGTQVHQGTEVSSNPGLIHLMRWQHWLHTCQSKPRSSSLHIEALPWHGFSATLCVDLPCSAVPPCKHFECARACSGGSPVQLLFFTGEFQYV